MKKKILENQNVYFVIKILFQLLGIKIISNPQRLKFRENVSGLTLPSRLGCCFALPLLLCLKLELLSRRRDLSSGLREFCGLVGVAANAVGWDVSAKRLNSKPTSNDGLFLRK